MSRLAMENGRGSVDEGGGQETEDTGDQSPRRKVRMTDAELMRRIEAGEMRGAIAQELGVSKVALWRRLKHAEKQLPRARQAEEILSQFQELLENYRVLQEVRNGCLRQLRNSAGEIDLSPRSGEGPGDGATGRADATGRRGTALTAGEPVTQLLRTLEAMRHHLAMVSQMTDRLYEVQEVEQFQQEVIAAVAEADPAVADRIRARIHERRAVRRARRNARATH